MRVAARWWIGVLSWLAYVVVILVVGEISGVPYTSIADNPSTIWRGADLFLVCGAVLLVVIASVLGWWRPALFEKSTSRHKWPIIAPALMAFSALLTLAVGVDWSRIDFAYFFPLLLLGIMVGFNEEFVTRGLLLVGLRASLREPWVWFITSALFGMMHAGNVLFGAPVGGTMQQVGLAFLGGTAFYIVRRVTGSLIWAMALHGLWDFATFATGHAPGVFVFGSFIGIAAEVLALVFVFFTFRSTADAIPPVPETASAAR
ncbi:CPBP family intramembrane metalloprotease [Planctomonas sp. JC2975]|uniref:CPBP family intramembrane glutamic endopeptidase n=1 Tax=Planctomonas sp. JC2975 TaxID=2729626 RepID=UPI001475A805|nr:CPBP family intramembrane glutamic endopeptidase [Planctomonas sp. JC2975]NNC13502.1 CPBP family intramembrane metalloprotease [Planctomonas sp. JC2975]